MKYTKSLEDKNIQLLENAYDTLIKIQDRYNGMLLDLNIGDLLRPDNNYSLFGHNIVSTDKETIIENSSIGIYCERWHDEPIVHITYCPRWEEWSIKMPQYLLDADDNQINKYISDYINEQLKTIRERDLNRLDYYKKKVERIDKVLSIKQNKQENGRDN